MQQQQQATATAAAATMPTGASPVTTTRPKPYMASDLVQALKGGMITCDKPKKTKSETAWTFYPQSKDRGNTSPVIMLPKLIAPFLPSVPKQKTVIESWTDYNLELSVTADMIDMIDMSTECEAFSNAAVNKHAALLYPRLHQVVIDSYRAPCMRLTKKQMANDPEGYPRLFRVKVHPQNTKFLKYIGQSETGRLKYTMGCFEDLQPYCPVVACVTWQTCYVATTSHGCKFFANSVLIFPPSKLGQMSGEEAVEVFSSFADQEGMMTENVDSKSAMAAFGTSTADDISNGGNEASSNVAANTYDAYENDEDDDM